MLDTRKRLLQLLDRDKITGNLLAEISKVPAPTIYRYLKGDIGEPRASTICKWALAFNVSEAQMRGIDPIEGLDEIREIPAPVSLESVLTPDELVVIEGMRRSSKDLRRAWLMLGKELCKNIARTPRSKDLDERITIDRRRGEKWDAFPGIERGVKYRKPTKPGQESKGGILGEPKEA